MLKKVLLLTLTISLIYILGAVASAAPQTIEPGYRGNANVINVTNPDDGITTFKNHVVVSVTGEEGTLVTLYTYDPSTRKYHVFVDKSGESSWEIGPLGLFYKRVPIGNGINYVGVLGEYYGGNEFIVRRADHANPSIRDGIKNILIKRIEDVIN